MGMTRLTPLTLFRSACLLLCCSMLPFASVFAKDAHYPSRPITLIVPWPAGGQTDISMRVLAEGASKHLGQPIVVENRPGAGGTMVAPALRNAAPDGYVIGQIPLTVYRFPFQQKVGWDPLRDIAPVILISGYTFGIVVPANSPFQTFRDLVQWAKQHPGQLTVGSTGVGTTAHLAMEDILQQQKIDYIHVPYKGTADQMVAVASGALMAGVNSTGFAPFVETGRLRLLGIFGEHRSARWPQVPTLREMGYANAVHTSPYGVGVPAGTPPHIIKRLHDAFKLAMVEPAHLQEIAKYDQELSYLGTADYTHWARQTSAREKKFVERMQLRGERQ